MAVLPGLVNGHTHLSQTFLRGLADDRPLLRWLKEVIWPAQAAMTPEDHYLAATLGLVENLRCGVTTVVQHHKLPGRDYVDAAAAPPRRRPADGAGPRLGGPGRVRRAAGHILAEFAWLYETWHVGARFPRPASAVALGHRWRPGAAATTPCARSPPWRGRGALPTHIHVAEAQDEIDLMLAALRQGGISNGWPTWAAWARTRSSSTRSCHRRRDSISSPESGATVVHCPTSNLYLASGAAPVRKMLDRGIPVALGTDGSASNNSQDLLECAKIGALLAKHATVDAQALVAGGCDPDDDDGDGACGLWESATPAAPRTHTAAPRCCTPGALGRYHHRRSEQPCAASRCTVRQSALVYNASGAGRAHRHRGRRYPAGRGAGDDAGRGGAVGSVSGRGRRIDERAGISIRTMR